MKRLLSHVALPLPVCMEFLLLGGLLWSFTKWKKLGRALVVAGTALLLVFGYPWLPRFALGRLESQYPTAAVDGGRKTEDGGQKAEDGGQGTEDGRRKAEGGASVFQWSGGAWYIMVLGSGFSADTNRPPEARFGDEGLKRIVEGVRLHRLLTNSTLLVSVPGPAISKREKEEVLGELLSTFGLATNAAQICAEAWDTEDEIAWCKRLTATNRVLLVSSAYHLPRAMVIARKLGLDAIPAPSGFLVDTATRSPWNPGRLFPSSANLYNSERAIHEWLGLGWEWVRGGRRAEDGGRKTGD